MKRKLTTNINNNKRRHALTGMFKTKKTKQKQKQKTKLNMRNFRMTKLTLKCLTDLMQISNSEHDCFQITAINS